jgi:hypothetical protein
MEVSVHLQGLHEFSFAPPIRQVALATPTIGHRDIPPERIGLDGNYDHAGLSKRVTRLLSDHFGCLMVEPLRISQRGQVVVILSRAGIAENLISPIVGLILQLEGAASVEINGVRHLSRSYVFH